MPLALIYAALTGVVAQSGYPSTFSQNTYAGIGRTLTINAGDGQYLATSISSSPPSSKKFEAGVPAASTPTPARNPGGLSPPTLVAVSPLPPSPVNRVFNETSPVPPGPPPVLNAVQPLPIGPPPVLNVTKPLPPQPVQNLTYTPFIIVKGEQVSFPPEIPANATIPVTNLTSNLNTTASINVLAAGISTAIINLDNKKSTTSIADLWSTLSALLSPSNSTNTTGSAAPAFYIPAKETFKLPFVGYGVAINNGSISLSTSEANNLGVSSVTVVSVIIVNATSTSGPYIILLMRGVSTSAVQRRGVSQTVYFSKILFPDTITYTAQQGMIYFVLMI